MQEIQVKIFQSAALEDVTSARCVAAHSCRGVTLQVEPVVLLTLTSHFHMLTCKKNKN